MKIKIIYVLFAVILAGCAGSPLQTGVEAEKNRMQIGDVRMGMSQFMVRRIMGPAYKKEIRMIGGREYEVWYYLTKGTLLYQTRYLDRNFTPFIFSQGELVGWGWRYFGQLFEPGVEEEKYAPENFSKESSEGMTPKNQKLEETIKKILEEENNSNVRPQEAQPSTEAPMQKQRNEKMPETSSQNQTLQENISPNKTEIPPQSQSLQNQENQTLEKPTEDTMPQAEKMNKQNEMPNEVPVEKNSESQNSSIPALEQNPNNLDEKVTRPSSKETPSCKSKREKDYNWWE